MNAIRHFDNLPETNEEISNFFLQVKESFLSGTENGLKRWIQFKSFEKLLKMFSSDSEIKEVVLIEAEKYEAKTFDAYNAKIQIKESGTKFDFNNDSILLEINKQIEELTAKKKARETMLKSLTQPVFDETTGEEIKPAIRVSSKTIVSITLK